MPLEICSAPVFWLLFLFFRYIYSVAFVKEPACGKCWVSNVLRDPAFVVCMMTHLRGGSSRNDNSCLLQNLVAIAQICSAGSREGPSCV